MINFLQMHYWTKSLGRSAHCPQTTWALPGGQRDLRNRLAPSAIPDPLHGTIHTKEPWILDGKYLHSVRTVCGAAADVHSVHALYCNPHIQPESDGSGPSLSHSIIFAKVWVVMLQYNVGATSNRQCGHRGRKQVTHARLGMQMQQCSAVPIDVLTY